MSSIKKQPQQSAMKWKPIAIGGALWLSANLFAWWYLGLSDSPQQKILSPEEIGRFERRIVGEEIGKRGEIISEYRLLKPEKISHNQKYPLVVFLHGSGERGSDGVKQLQTFPVQMSSSPWREEYPCFLIAPQCPTNHGWGERSALVSRSVARFDPLDDVLVMIQEVSQLFPVDPQRIYLTGHSMGAYGVWNLAAREPQMFAALVPLSGGGDPETAEQLKEIPIWAFHGETDHVVPVSETAMMIDSIKKTGGEPKFTSLAGVGHRIRDQVYQDKQRVVPWMFRQVNQRVPRPDSN